MASASFAEATWAERSVFLFYMTLWVTYGLVNEHVTLAGMQYNPVTLVWVQELLKIIMSVALFFIQDGGGLDNLGRNVQTHWTMLCWYMIPAGLYALTDVLTYINLRHFDPATYYLLSEMKLVVTALVHQIIFQRKLHPWHWVALGIITLGGTIKTLESLQDDDDDVDAELNDSTTFSKPTLIHYIILLVQILASTVAGVYNEKLLKDKASVPLNLQNLCLYSDGIFVLSLGLLIVGASEQSFSEALAPSHMIALWQKPAILAMAFVMSTAGIVTSRFLKVYDSVRKSIAASLVVATLPFLSWICFQRPVSSKMVVSIVFVVMGMSLYSSQPAPGSQAVVETVVLVDEGDTELLFLPSALSSPTRRQEYSRVSMLKPGADFDFELRDANKGGRR